MFLFAEEKWVADNVALQITREEDLDATSCLDLAWAEVRQALPRAEQASRHKVGVLVDADTAFLLVRIFVALLFTGGTVITAIFSCLLNSFCRGLHDEVVGLSAADFAEEAHKGAGLRRGELLKGLLEKVDLLLGETDPRCCEQTLV